MFPILLIRRTIPAMRLSTKVAGYSKQYLPTIANKYGCLTADTTFPRRPFSAQNSTEMLTVDYNYVKDAITNNNILIVDVREPEEIKEHGKIPNSINIPLGNVSTVLSTMPETEFEKTYQRPKPTENTQIIFYCMIGKRSGKAQQNAINAGFKNVKNYLGSWTEWATKSQS